MNADPALQAQLQDMMHKARRALKAARRHLDDLDFDFAASRAYYAAFLRYGGRTSDKRRDVFHTWRRDYDF